MDVVTRPASTPTFPWRQVGVLALIGILLAAAAAVYVGSQRDVPAPFGLAANGAVVYSKGGDILVRDTMDGVPRLLVATTANEIADSLSPLGTYVAIVRPQGEDALDLAVVRVAGGEPVPIGGPYAGVNSIAWSPDEHQIAVSHDVAGLPTITIVNVDGTGDRDLDLGMAADSAAWRPPDGSQLSFRGEVDGNWALFLAEADGTDPIQLDVARDLLEAPYEVLGPAWSPTGDRIAFHRLVLTPGNGNGNGFRIHVAAIDGTAGVTAQQTYEFDATSDDEFNVSWMPTGDELLFTRHDATEEALSIARPEAGAVARDIGAQFDSRRTALRSTGWCDPPSRRMVGPSSSDC